MRNSGLEFAVVGNLHGVYFGTPSSVPLKLEEMHEILIELSSRTDMDPDGFIVERI
ncbi:hypothetical protein [Cylindrospermopsis raciborskii]|uniref:hypothetical protein n=1 Tax=Cylindrospermopsis raciborskii TaxID=77022 RepID=UPI0002E8F644|nr:hypothetical protein [Cylindrospermopsis raciborskii]